MGNHVPPISLGGMKLSKSIDFDNPIEIYLWQKKWKGVDMKLALRSILTVVAYIEQPIFIWPDKNSYLAPDIDSFPLPDKNYYLVESTGEAVSTRLEF